MPTSKRRSKDSFAVATSSYPMNIPEIVSLWIYDPLKFGEMNSSVCYFYVGNLICSVVHVLWVFGKHLFILFHFRFLINILLLTDNAKHELNNVGSLSPERTVLRTDSRVKVLAKDGLRRESGQGIVLGVVCHRCWLHLRRYWKIILKKRMDASFKNECKFCQVAIKYYSTK